MSGPKLLLFAGVQLALTCGIALAWREGGIDNVLQVGIGCGIATVIVGLCWLFEDYIRTED